MADGQGDWIVPVSVTWGGTDPRESSGAEGHCKNGYSFTQTRHKMGFLPQPVCCGPCMCPREPVKEHPTDYEDVLCPNGYCYEATITIGDAKPVPVCSGPCECLLVTQVDPGLQTG